MEEQDGAVDQEFDEDDDEFGVFFESADDMKSFAPSYLQNMSCVHVLYALTWTHVRMHTAHFNLLVDLVHVLLENVHTCIL